MLREGKREVEWKYRISELLTCTLSEKANIACKYTPILVAPIAAGPIATSAYIFFYMIGTGFRSVPWL